MTPPPVTPHTLATPRLSLAPPAAADLDGMAAMWGDPAVTDPLGIEPVSREAAWHRLLRYAGHWQLAGYGHWIVRLADTGAYLGEVGLMDARRATDPPMDDAPEAGWAFAPHAQGRGYATEACAAMLAWADGRGLSRTVCMIAPGNAPSLRLAARLGYGPAGDLSYGGRPMRLFARAQRLSVASVRPVSLTMPGATSKL